MHLKTNTHITAHTLTRSKQAKNKKCLSHKIITFSYGIIIGCRCAMRLRVMRQSKWNFIRRIGKKNIKLKEETNTLLLAREEAECAGLMTVFFSSCTLWLCDCLCFCAMNDWILCVAFVLLTLRGTSERWQRRSQAVPWNSVGRLNMYTAPMRVCVLWLAECAVVRRA